jgi:hypothetical protein
MKATAGPTLFRLSSRRVGRTAMSSRLQLDCGAGPEVSANARRSFTVVAHILMFKRYALHEPGAVRPFDRGYAEKICLQICIFLAPTQQ